MLHKIKLNRLAKAKIPLFFLLIQLSNNNIKAFHLSQDRLEQPKLHVFNNNIKKKKFFFVFIF